MIHYNSHGHVIMPKNSDVVITDTELISDLYALGWVNGYRGDPFPDYLTDEQEIAACRQGYNHGCDAREAKK